MMKFFYSLMLCVALLLNAACTAHYYGYSEEEWNQLSEEDKAKAKIEYDEIIRRNREQEQKDLITDQKHNVIERGLSY